MAMANGIYDSFTDDVFNQAIDLTSDTVHAFLVTNSYTPNIGTDEKRSDADADEITGAGYTAGGVPVTVTIGKDTTSHKETITFGDAVWTGATILARGVVLTIWRGGAASADNLICCATFGSDESDSSGNFTAHNSTALTYAN